MGGLMQHLRAFVLVVPCCLAAPTNNAVAQHQAAQRLENAIIVHTGRGATPARDDAGVAQLVQRTQARGRIRVIVGLDLTMPAETELSPAEAARQSLRLRRMQDDLAARVLGGRSAAGVVRFSRHSLPEHVRRRHPSATAAE